jgi:hypothetical protein
LVVSAWSDAEENLETIVEPWRFEQESLIQVRAVRGDDVDLRRAITATSQTFARATVRVAAHDDNFALERRLLAVHAQESRTDIEDEV